MECIDLDSYDFFLDGDAIDNPLDIHLESNSFAGTKAVPDHGRYAQLHCTNAPDPPPLPGTSYDARRSYRKVTACSRVHEEVLDSWDKLFLEGYQADLRVSTDDGTEILSHSCVLGVKSPVLRAILEDATPNHGFRCIRISGAPSEAVHVFVRFLYSSRFEQEQMKKHVLHLLALSHAFSVPSLKTVCIDQLARNFLSPDNVVDMLQLAELCDAPRLSVVCTRMIIGDFKTISLTDGWKLMRRVNPSLEQELLESLVEADTYSYSILDLSYNVKSEKEKTPEEMHGTSQPGSVLVVGWFEAAIAQEPSAGGCYGSRQASLRKILEDQREVVRTSRESSTRSRERQGLFYNKAEGARQYT
ncbi:unnamed protein product [Urochloa humidicola]